MMNLDWFQPYEKTTYSTGVIYAAICNLPRDIRFKPENMLILGILPGPHEVGLHKINHYLSPIITELELLWEGLTLERTNKCPNGKEIRAALINYADTYLPLHHVIVARKGLISNVILVAWRICANGLL